VREDVDEIVGSSFSATRLVDVEAVTCSTCHALVVDDWFIRLRHAEWHVEQGHARLPGA
jgi:hypothetical protein